MEENNIETENTEQTHIPPQEEQTSNENIELETPTLKKTKSCPLMNNPVCKAIAYVILLVAVVVIYILHFTSNQDSSKLANMISSGNNSIMLTVNNDSIIKHFVLAELLTKDLETEAIKYQQELASKQSSLQERYNNYQINVQNNVLTQTQIQNAEQQLQKEAAGLQGLQEQYSHILAAKEESVHREITDSIINAARRVNDKKYKADYVLATSAGSAILYANKVYDITDEVIKELNNAYKNK